MQDYAAEYFERHAQGWLESAYSDELRFPVGRERIRLALEAVTEGRDRLGTLVDLGCGGGGLCVEAARLGWRAVGVDVAPAMIREAERVSGGLDIRYVVASYDASGLAEGQAEAVTALGLVEYLPEDGSLLLEARRLLCAGGRLAVSCRNRLFNLLSVNAYTARELESGDAAALLAELERLLPATGWADLRRLAAELADAGSELEAAAAADGRHGEQPARDRIPRFERERRQHTPAELRAAGESAGLRFVAALAVHLHPLPPALERHSPRLYNRLALAWQRPLERSGLGLALSSTFVGVFERP